MPNITWSQLKVLPKTRFISSMYIWLFVVPLIAKSLSKVSGIATLIVFGHVFSVNLGLPFTWQVFYFSALLFTLGNIIFLLRCPRIVKDHDNAAEFRAAGKGWNQLHMYRDDAEYPQDVFRADHQDVMNKMQDPEHRYFELFWKVYDHANSHRAPWLITCAGLYGFGLALITWVLIENLKAVVCLMVGE